VNILVVLVMINGNVQYVMKMYLLVVAQKLFMKLVVMSVKYVTIVEMQNVQNVEIIVIVVGVFKNGRIK
jgi:hypothetical protein